MRYPHDVATKFRDDKVGILRDLGTPQISRRLVQLAGGVEFGQDAGVVAGDVTERAGTAVDGCAQLRVDAPVDRRVERHQSPGELTDNGLGVVTRLPVVLAF